MRFGFILIVGVLLLVGLFVVLRPQAKKVPPAHKTFVLRVKDNKLISGPTLLKARQGDMVTIIITADVDGELHLHGYDKHVDFKKNAQAQLTVLTDIAGHFEYELEDTKTEIGALDVEPQ